jgi:hypothetical protein
MQTDIVCFEGDHLLGEPATHPPSDGFNRGFKVG